MGKINLTTKSKEQELILDYLEKNASDILIEKINNGTQIEQDGKQLINRKDLNGFFSFATDEAKKLVTKDSKSACVQDNIVFGWAIHYFEEDSIIGTLFNLDGSEYKTKPIKKETIPNTPPKKEEPKIKQISLFDFMDTTEMKENNDNTITEEEPNEKEFEQEEELNEVINNDGEIINVANDKNNVESSYFEELNILFENNLIAR